MFPPKGKTLSPRKIHEVVISSTDNKLPKNRYSSYLQFSRILDIGYLKLKASFVFSVLVNSKKQEGKTSPRRKRNKNKIKSPNLSFFFLFFFIILSVNWKNEHHVDHLVAENIGEASKLKEKIIMRHKVNKWLEARDCVWNNISTLSLSLSPGLN